VIISTSHRFVFVHIYRTGGSTLTRLLGPLADPAFRQPDAQMEGSRGWQETWHESGNQHEGLWPEAIERLRGRGLLLSDFLIASFVRNPFTWTLSIWEEFYRNGNTTAGSAYLREHPDGRFVSFLRYVRDMRGREVDLPWGMRPQQWFFDNPEVSPGFLGRHESFATDVRRLMMIIGASYPSELPHEEQRDSAAERARLSTFYDAEAQDLVRDLFAVDFQAFGYSPELPTDQPCRTSRA
jgi:hypothetical protein